MISSRIENMPTKSRKGTQVRISESVYDQLRKLVKHTGDTQTEVLETLINMATVHDLLRPDWQDRLTAALKKGMWHIQQQEHFESMKKCSGLRAADEKWKCIQGRYQKTPMIRILADNRDDALNLCDGCKVTLEPILLNYELQGKIQQLENRLEARAGVTFKAPVCNRGAVLTADGTEFRGCERGTGRQHKTVSIEKWCKVYENKTPCYSYAEIPISVADRESQVNMDR